MFFRSASVLVFLCVVALAADPGTNLAQSAGDARTAAFAQSVESELRGNILPFWLKHTRDREHGGFFGEIDGELRVKRDAPRGALLTSRVLWTFSAAYRRWPDPAYREMASWAYADLNARFWDPQHEGLYWRVGVDGSLLEPRKIIYVQAFGIYGLSEYYRATGDPAALNRAIELYRLIERHAHDSAHQGYFEEFTRDWQISRDRGFRRSAMGSRDQKSQNVHLHILEAYTNLLRVWPDRELRERLRELIEVMQTRILDRSTFHLRLFLAEDWTPRSDTISFGHDIEYSWLVTEAAEVLGEPELVKWVVKDAVRIAEATLAAGVDPDGGVLAEADPQGLTSTFKEWWPQAEAAVGFLNAFQLSRDPKHLEASFKSWDFIERHLVDGARGEWFLGVSRDGKRKATMKVSFWKCPYHNGRACMELLDRLRTLASTQPDIERAVPLATPSP